VRRFWLLAALAAALITATGLAAPRRSAAQTGGSVSVAGARFMRDGSPWIPKGVVATALIAAAATAGPVGPAYIAAREEWGPAEVAAIRAYGADTINLKASQPALDPQGGHYDPTYLARVEAAVGLARRAGLNVIVSMEWAKATGIFGQLEMPTGPEVAAPVSSTVRAWRVLAPAFGRDLGVMYQLFDEPCARVDTPEAWRRWQIGHQQAIDAVRRAGARNVVIAEGIRCGKWLTHVPPLVDRLNSIAYAVHPYQMPQGLRNSNVDMYTARDFDRNFGRWQATGHPVIATEWNIWRRACHDGADGNPTSPQIAVNLLTYLRDHGIGLVIWAFDLGGTVWADRDWRVPTRLEPFEGCGRPMGAGALVREYFLTGRIVPQ
jgi:hypothetical protein